MKISAALKLHYSKSNVNEAIGLVTWHLECAEVNMTADLNKNITPPYPWQQQHGCPTAKEVGQFGVDIICWS